MLIKVNNFISGARKCTAMVFFREEKGRLYTIPLITNLWCQPRLFSSSFIRCLCDQQRNKVTKMLGLYSVQSSIDSRPFNLHPEKWFWGCHMRFSRAWTWKWYFVTKIVLTYYVKKNVQVIEKNLWIFEITRTIYSNSKRTEQFLVTEC